MFKVCKKHNFPLEYKEIRHLGGKTFEFCQKCEEERQEFWKEIFKNVAPLPDFKKRTDGGS